MWGLTHPLTFAFKFVPINVWCMEASFNAVNAVPPWVPTFKVYEFAQGQRHHNRILCRLSNVSTSCTFNSKKITRDRWSSGTPEFQTKANSVQWSWNQQVFSSSEFQSWNKIIKEDKGLVLKRRWCVYGVGEGGGDINLPLSCAIKRAPVTASQTTANPTFQLTTLHPASFRLCFL